MFRKKIQSLLKDYFTLTSRERKGALSLATLILLQCGYLTWTHHIQKPTIDHELLNSLEKIPVLEKVQQENVVHVKEIESPETKFVITPFDPNTASLELLMGVGIAEKQARIIRKYVEKGG